MPSYGLIDACESIGDERDPIFFVRAHREGYVRLLAAESFNERQEPVGRNQELIELRRAFAAAAPYPKRLRQPLSRIEAMPSINGGDHHR